MLQHRRPVLFPLLIYYASYFQSGMKCSECVSVFFGLFMTTEAFERTFPITESTADEQRLTLWCIWAHQPTCEAVHRSTNRREGQPDYSLDIAIVMPLWCIWAHQPTCEAVHASTNRREGQPDYSLDIAIVILSTAQLNKFVQIREMSPSFLGCCTECNAKSLL